LITRMGGAIEETVKWFSKIDSLSVRQPVFSLKIIGFLYILEHKFNRGQLGLRRVKSTVDALKSMNEILDRNWHVVLVMLDLKNAWPPYVDQRMKEGGVPEGLRNIW